MTALSSPIPAARRLLIDYESAAFPAGSGVTNGWAQLATSWNELLWAALTVGRPNRAYVFAHGQSSLYEAMFRLSLIRMALEQSGPTATRLRRTPAARTLDPSEKGAINYFVGMTLAKLFSARLLNAPWALHVDVFGASVGAMLTQRSRPDLLAQIHGTDEWIAMESKGRISPPDATAIQRAKAQATRIGVRGATMRHHIGCITFLRSDLLQFYWEDPESSEPWHAAEPVGEAAWEHYYRPAVALASLDQRGAAAADGSESVVDATVMIHPAIADVLRQERWADAKAKCEDMQEAITTEGYHADGLIVTAGPSWQARFEEGERR